MNNIKALLLTSAAIAMFDGTALGADILPAPEPMGGFYAGVFGGATWFTDNGADFTYDPFKCKGSCSEDGEISLDTDTGFLVGGVLGYNWGDTGLRQNSSSHIRRPI
jgi:hypothetical protein